VAHALLDARPVTERDMLIPKGAHIVLTPRERDVVHGILASRTNKEIAQTLGLTVQAVKNILSAVYGKCHVRNRLELALFAVRHDLVSTQPSPFAPQSNC
jgi:DNA-binding NarL/FixJ family response regulator